MKKPCSNAPKYMYSGKESSPLGLGIAAEPLILGTIQEGRDNTNWIVTLKNGIQVWSRITRLSEIVKQENSEIIPKEEAISTKKKSVSVRKKVAPITKVEDIKPDLNDVSKKSVQPPVDEKSVAKRKPTNYNIYMSYKLEQLAKEDNTMKPKERFAHAVALWQSMDDNAKQEVVEKAREAMIQKT